MPESGQERQRHQEETYESDRAIFDVRAIRLPLRSLPGYYTRQRHISSVSDTYLNGLQERSSPEVESRRGGATRPSHLHRAKLARANEAKASNVLEEYMDANVLLHPKVKIERKGVARPITRAAAVE